ncbi:hypothetical protein [Kiritimatiella glycovorans]|nr:hypothetical protein [Kiritimatiella glycovorans]
MKKVLLTLAAIGLTAGAAMADVSFAGISGYYNDVDDNRVELGDKFCVFIDIDDDGIDGAGLSNYEDNNATWLSVLATDTFEWDSDDLLVWDGAMDGSGDGVFDLTTSNGGSDPQVATGDMPAGYDTGDPMYVLYFPGLSGSATSPGSITQVGYYTQDDWDAPVDPGGSEDLNAVDFDGLQSAIAVPEPATGVIAIVSGLGLAFFRRRTMMRNRMIG